MQWTDRGLHFAPLYYAGGQHQLVFAKAILEAVGRCVVRHLRVGVGGFLTQHIVVLQQAVLHSIRLFVVSVCETSLRCRCCSYLAGCGPGLERCLLSA